MAQDEKNIALIAGLGNVGNEYARQRHNAGFWFVDRLAEAHDAEFRSIKKMGVSCEIEVAGRRVRLFKPDGYMNNSGQGLGAAARYWKVSPENILVAHDELDFPTGSLRLRFSGGAAGHNGVRSIMEHIGGAFWRLRIGIGHPEHNTRGAGYVLSNAPASERQLIAEGFERFDAVLSDVVSGAFDEAMTRLHTEEAGGDNGV